jgi:protein-L-isoaspartate(D-aspartate) O-methyltransferase
VIRGFGPGGAAVAAHLAERAADWDILGRPGPASLRLRAYPVRDQTGDRAAVADRAGDLAVADRAAGAVILDRRHARLVLDWPAP